MQVGLVLSTQPLRVGPVALVPQQRLHHSQKVVGRRVWGGRNDSLPVAVMAVSMFA
jgi:hypothetical protein